MRSSLLLGSVIKHFSRSRVRQIGCDDKRNGVIGRADNGGVIPAQPLQRLQVSTIPVEWSD